MARRTKRKVKNRSKAHRKHTKKERSRRIKSRSNVRFGTKLAPQKKKREEGPWKRSSHSRSSRRPPCRCRRAARCIHHTTPTPAPQR